MILLNNMTILIVDDNPLNVDLLAKVLKKRNYKVRIADSGERALKQISLQPPDLVLMDVMMPGVDGFEACRRLKSNPATADIPVIFITALSDMKDMLKGFQVGGADFLTKPFQAEEVLARVKAHLTIRKLLNDLSAKNEKLEKALEEVKTLQGIVPICSMCKKIRDDSGFWQQVEMYINKHVGTKFSHSYCPDCLEKEMKKLDKL